MSSCASFIVFEPVDLTWISQVLEITSIPLDAVLKDQLLIDFLSSKSLATIVIWCSRV